MITSQLPEFEDRDVQVVYDLLCGNEHPPNPEEHWEGWIARRIVAALRPTSVPVEGWLAETDAREKAATPGEWAHKSQINTADACTEDYVEIRGVRMFGRAEDCDFVACARRDIPALRRHIDRQASELVIERDRNAKLEGQADAATRGLESVVAKRFRQTEEMARLKEELLRARNE